MSKKSTLHSACILEISWHIVVTESTEVLDLHGEYSHHPALCSYPSQQLLSRQLRKLGPELYSKIGKGLKKSLSFLLIIKQDQPLCMQLYYQNLSLKAKASQPPKATKQFIVFSVKNFSYLNLYCHQSYYSLFFNHHLDPTHSGHK